MKSLIIFLMLFALIGCGGGANTANTNAAAVTGDVRVDILVKALPEGRELEFTFHTSQPTKPGDRTGGAKQVIQVEEAKLNGTALTPATNLSGETIYKTEGNKAKADNVVTAKINGKQYQGSTLLETALANKMTTVTLMPK